MRRPPDGQARPETAWLFRHDWRSHADTPHHTTPHRRPKHAAFGHPHRVTHSMVATTVAMRGPPTARPAHPKRARHSGDTARSLPALVPANAGPRAATRTSGKPSPEGCNHALRRAPPWAASPCSRHRTSLPPNTGRQTSVSPSADFSLLRRRPQPHSATSSAPEVRAAGMAGARLRPPPPAPPGPPRYSDGYRSAVPACPQPEHIGRWSKCPTLS